MYTASAVFLEHLLSHGMLGISKLRMKSIASLSTSYLPHYVKTQYLYFRVHANYFYLERFLNKLADDQWSCIAKGSIYYMKHMSIHPFTIVVN